MDKKITLSNSKVLVITFSLLVTMGLMIHQYIMFVRAYISPQKAIVLYINIFGEANFEMITLTISAIMGITTIFYILWFIRKGKKIVCYME